MSIPNTIKVCLAGLIILPGCVTAALGQDGAPTQQADGKVVFREPFTLKLQLDKKHYYVEEFKKVPYVQGGDVYLFCGDYFGLGLDIENGAIRGISYQRDLLKSDVALKFSQGPSVEHNTMMSLVIENRSQHKLFLDALMTVPGRKGVFKTSVVPVLPRTTNFESWPHPIVQLVLRNIRLQK